MHERTAPPRSRANWLSLALLCVAVLALPLARGGVDAGTEFAAVVLLGSAASLACWRSRAAPWSALVLLGVAAFVLLQLVPVPTWLHAMSPAARDVFRLSLGPLGRYPAARPLTLDLPATARALGTTAACAAAFVASASFAETRRRRSFLVLALAACAPLATAAFLGAALAGSGTLAAPGFPFVNPNHVAGLLALTAPVALGLALESGGNARAAWAIGFAAAVVVVFATLSRAGAAALVVATMLFLVRWRAARAGHAARAFPWIAFAAAAALGGAFLLVESPFSEKLLALRDDELKTFLWPAGARALLDYPFVGIGRGAFSTVFPAYRSDTVPVTYTHLENQWLQIPIEFGLPVGLAFLGTLAFLWARRWRRPASAPEIGVWAGLAGLGFQQLFDFSTELLGVAVPASVAFALLTRGQRQVRLPRGLVPGLAGVLCALGAAGMLLAWHVGDRASADIAAARSDRIESGAADAAAWRPADYLPHAAAGRRLAAERRCGEALPWLQRAMVLAPTHPAPHLDAGRCLVHRAPGTARREYRLAILYGDREALAEAETVWPALEDLYQVTPDTPQGLLALGALLATHRPADAARSYEQAWIEFAEPSALLSMTRSELAAGDPASALDAARLLLDQRLYVEEAHAAAAAALIALGQAEEARSELEKGLAAAPGSPVLIPLLAQQKLLGRQFSEARRLAESMIPRSPDEVAARQMIQARALAAQGRVGEAIDYAHQATLAQPNGLAEWVLYRELCLRADRFDGAISALRHLATLPGAPSNGYEREIAELQRRAAAEGSARPPPVDPALGPE